MTPRSPALVLLGLLACSSDTVIEDKPNAQTLDDSSAHWDDGPAPTPDPPIDDLDAGGDGDGASGTDAGTDAGADAGAASDAGQDAGGDGG